MAKIIAKTMQGREFLYSRQSAHKVSNASASAICAALNASHYNLKENEVWHVYDCSEYEMEYTHAAFQKFTRRKGRIFETQY